MKRCKITFTILLMFQVTIVVNFDLPVDVTGTADCETYLHRLVVGVGRLWSDDGFIGLGGQAGLASMAWPSTWWTGPRAWPCSRRLRGTLGRILSSWMLR